MKRKYKFLSLVIFSIFTILLTGFTDVNAATLVREQVPNVYYARRGGGKPYGTSYVENYTMDGKVVYCIEAGVAITTDSYVGKEGWINSPFSDEINKKIQLIGYYGYDYPSHQTQRFRLATQSLIWETTSGQIIELWTEIGGYGDYINIDYERNEIMKLVNAHYEKPSFKDETKDAVVGQEVVFEDTNGILSKFEIYSSENATSTIDGNTLKVIPNTVGNIVVDLARKSYTTEPTVVFIGNDGVSQKMAYFGLNDPILVRVNINTIGGDITINKLDNDTLKSEPQGIESSLENAVYGIYNYSDTLITTITTNSSGYAKSDILPDIGKYYLKEISPSKGYELDPNKYYFSITANNLNPVIEVYEKIIKRKVEINKYFSNGETGTLTPEGGIEFSIYDSKGNLVITIKSNDQGFASTNLVYGNYTVKQINTTPGYEKVEDFKIVVNSESPEIIRYSLTDAPINAKLKLVKIDADSKKPILFAGTTFKIKNIDTGEYVCQKISYPKQEEICKFTTNELGEFFTPSPLMSATYQIEEINAPSEYLLSSDYYTFRIDENSTFIEDDDYGKYVLVEFSNKKIKGNINVEKTGEVFNVLENDFDYTSIKLAGVEFSLYAAEDITTLDGIIHYKKGDLIKTLKSDSNGMVSFNDLYLGKYIVKETKTLTNYILDTKEYVVELTPNDNTTAIVSKTLKLTNKLMKSSLEMTKTDLVSGDVIPNTVIEIYTENDECIFVGKTDLEGKIKIDNLPVGKFYILEKEPATGYVITDEKVYFEILEDGKIIKAEMTNKPITGSLVFTKLSVSTSEPLPNTLIQINTENDELVFEGRTDESGMIVIDELRYGKYYILEREAPEGYILSEEKMFFEILEDGEIVKATMTNEKVIIEVPITGINEYPVIYIVSGILLLSGIGIVIYAKKKNKR